MNIDLLGYHHFVFNISDISYWRYYIKKTIDGLKIFSSGYFDLI